MNDMINALRVVYDFRNHFRSIVLKLWNIDKARVHQIVLVTQKLHCVTLLFGFKETTLNEYREVENIMKTL